MCDGVFGTPPLGRLKKLPNAEGRASADTVIGGGGACEFDDSVCSVVDAELAAANGVRNPVKKDALCGACFCGVSSLSSSLTEDRLPIESTEERFAAASKLAVGEAGEMEELAVGAVRSEDLGFAIFDPRKELKVFAKLAARVETSAAPAITAIESPSVLFGR